LTPIDPKTAVDSVIANLSSIDPDNEAEQKQGVTYTLASPETTPFKISNDRQLVIKQVIANSKSSLEESNFNKSKDFSFKVLFFADVSTRLKTVSLQNSVEYI